MSIIVRSKVSLGSRDLRGALFGIAWPTLRNISNGETIYLYD